jgi:hypothetical protein
MLWFAAGDPLKRDKQQSGVGTQEPECSEDKGAGDSEFKIQKSELPPASLLNDPMTQ